MKNYDEFYYKCKNIVGNKIKGLLNASCGRVVIIVIFFITISSGQRE